MEKVLIEIIGSQNIDNQFDKTEFKTVGTFEEFEEKYVIKYKEEQDAGEEPINVSVHKEIFAITVLLTVKFLWAFAAIPLSMNLMKTVANSPLVMI